MKVALFKQREAHDFWYSGLLDYIGRKGHSVDVLFQKPPKDVAEYGVVIIWNGNHPEDKQLEKECNGKDVSVCFMEIGYFPQKKFVMLSSHGSVGGDLFSGEEIPDLPTGGEEWLQEQFSRYSLRKQYKGGGDYIAGFLQLPFDTAVQVHSRFAHMQQFVEETQFLFPDDRVVFKAHPREKKPRVKTEHPLYRGRSIWPHILRSKCCVAINSTCLYEAVFAGVPVTALGECPLKRHPDKHREIVHEILLRQLPVGSSDIEEQVHRSVGEIF